MPQHTSIVWFRQDLRLSDNPALVAAAELGKILPIYIDDTSTPTEFQLGAASKVWLRHSLNQLNKSLKQRLNTYKGKPQEILSDLVKRFKISDVFWNQCFEPWSRTQEKHVKAMLTKLNIDYSEFNGSYLWHPGTILKDDGSYYKVFTAYKKKSVGFQKRKPVSNVKTLSLVKDNSNSCSIESLELLPAIDWDTKIEKTWNIGEDGAKHALDEFIENGLSGYKKGRDFPSLQQTSKLSPHLHFGEISPAQIVEAIFSSGYFDINETDTEHFLSEVIWREFSCYLMYHFKDLHCDNFQKSFNGFPWKSQPKKLAAWQTGNTGYPVIDAGMRELWQTGYMHNRVRMLVASFLVKNLMIHWHKGRDWFWDCLVDADLANNSASWQWVAGSGADAAPYFRIFNPVTQGEKFDKDGAYTRKFVPEISSLPDKYLHKPWLAPENIREEAGVILGKTYPNPIVDLAETRNQALEAYKKLRKK